MISKDSFHKTSNRKDDEICDFREFKTIRSFGKDIANGTITLGVTDEERSNPLDEILTFKGSKVGSKIRKRGRGRRKRGRRKYL